MGAQLLHTLSSSCLRAGTEGAGVASSVATGVKVLRVFFCTSSSISLSCIGGLASTTGTTTGTATAVGVGTTAGDGTMRAPATAFHTVDVLHAQRHSQTHSTPHALSKIRPQNTQWFEGYTKGSCCSHWAAVKLHCCTCCAFNVVRPSNLADALCLVAAHNTVTAAGNCYGNCCGKHGTVHCLYVWYGMVWYGMVWYGMVWYCTLPI